MKKLKITKGKWRVSTFSKYNIETEDGRSVASSGTYSTNTDNGEHIIENEANAQLIAEAGTVTNQCGLTPKELLEQRDKLREALFYLYHSCPNNGDWVDTRHLRDAWDILEETK